MAGALSERLSSVRLDPDAEQPARFREPQAAEQNRTGPRNDLAKIKARIQRELIAELGTEADLNTPQGRRQVELLLNELVEAQGLSLPRVERMRLLDAVVAEVLSFGPSETGDCRRRKCNSMMTTTSGASSTASLLRSGGAATKHRRWSTHACRMDRA